MKSSGNSKNQRLSKPRHRKQQHLLEVSVRRDIARSQRNRAVLAFVCKTILVVGLCVGAYVGGKEGLRRFLWENPDYFLTDVRVATDGALTREQILGTANVIEGRNIFTVDLAKARAALDALPQVERAEIQRVLPNRIGITIAERKPIAWVTHRASEDPTVSDRAFLIDARGVVMRSKTMLPSYLHLPVIAGVEIENLAPGQRVRTFEMLAALDLIRLNVDNVRFQPRVLDISSGYCVRVTDQAHRKITFGLDRVDLQLERLMRFVDFIEPSGKEIQTVNLLVERNTPFTFADAVVDTDSKSLTPPGPKSDGSKDKKDPKEKAPTTVKKAEAVSTPASVPATTPAKESTPSTRRRVPAESVKKPFRING